MEASAASDTVRSLEKIRHCYSSRCRQRRQTSPDVSYGSSYPETRAAVPRGGGGRAGRAPARSSCVVGLPDDDLGQRVHAIVDALVPPAEAELREHLAKHLVRYKVPRSFEFVDELLRDDAGKVRRSALREARLLPGAPIDPG